MKRPYLAVGLASVVAIATLVNMPASAAPVTQATTTSPPSDIRELPVDQKYSTAELGLGQVSARAAAPTLAVAETPPVGTVRQWIALDDALGRLYRKNYTLRGVGNNIEVWVADDLAFPAGDCRSQITTSTTITDDQVAHLISEFDTNMYPTETGIFSTPPDRDGTNAQLGPDANGNGGVYTGAGNRTVTLVDNVRDDNYFLGVNAAPTYIAGFFSTQFNELLDRNVMTIDAFDWQHRTTENPPDQPTTDPCTSRPARPTLYEGVFAHEYQHLLQYYKDPAEVSWVNEGLSDFAESMTCYGDATKTVFQPDSESHIYCYQGFGTVLTPYNPNPRNCGGPENSLTLWGDQPGPDEILADYGEAWSFMLFLRDRYGLGLISTLHRDSANHGLVGVQRALDGYASGTDVYDVLHDF